MHNIIFHILGIALLEICFFFYYIGPIESVMFSSNIISLLKDSYIPNILNIYQNNSMIDYSIIYNLTDQEELLLYNDFTDGKHDRDSNNKELFVLSIKILVLIFCIGIITYFIHHKCKEKILFICKEKVLFICNKYEKASINPVDNNDYFCNELVCIEDGSTNIVVYENDNIINDENINDENINDENINDENITNSNSFHNIMDVLINRKTNACNIYNVYKRDILYYFVFACCVIGFEYAFFQCIVLYYSPLSIRELRYLIYKEVMKKYTS
mgnify:FL=1